MLSNFVVLISRVCLQEKENNDAEIIKSVEQREYEHVS